MPRTNRKATLQIPASCYSNSANQALPFQQNPVNFTNDIPTPSSNLPGTKTIIDADPNKAPSICSSFVDTLSVVPPKLRNKNLIPLSQRTAANVHTQKQVCAQKRKNKQESTENLKKKIGNLKNKIIDKEQEIAQLEAKLEEQKSDAQKFLTGVIQRLSTLEISHYQTVYQLLSELQNQLSN